MVGSLDHIRSQGQFPAYCPQCRADWPLGTTVHSLSPAEAELGRIDEVAVTFLVQQKYVRPPLICEWGEAELRAVGA